MEARRTAEGIRVGGDARQRLYDARGYGEPAPDGEIWLTPVEAVHLLRRGDLEAIDGLELRAFFGTIDEADFFSRLVVYTDLRERGYYLDPIERLASEPTTAGTFAVYERGAGRSREALAFTVRVVEERETIPIVDLEATVLAVVDDECEVGYLESTELPIEGSVSFPDRPSEPFPATIAGNRGYAWEGGARLYEAAFFGRPVGGRQAIDDVLALSLVETQLLAERDYLALDPAVVRQAGRNQEGQRYQRRYRAYRTLRTNGLVPKTGYKFGTDFRLYQAFEGLSQLSHSDWLVRVLAPTASARPEDLSLDVRLAHGVGKRMVFAITPESEDQAVSWVSLTRVTP